MDGSSVTHIRRLVGFPDLHWSLLCAPMMSIAHQLDALDLIRRVLMLRHGVYLPVGAPAEDIYRLRDLWTYAIMVAAMMSKGMELKAVPSDGLKWLNSDKECMRSISMIQNGTHAGILYELLQRASAQHPERGNGFKGSPPKPDEREREEPETKKVHNELFTDTDSEDASVISEKATSRSGGMFLDWLRHGIKSGRMKVNEPVARVHVVSEGVFIISPVTFKDYDENHWDDVENDLLSMGLHQPGPSNNMLTYKVQGKPGVCLKGILIPDISLLFDSPPDVNLALEKTSVD